MIECLFLISRQGKTRLTKWYTTSLSTKEKNKLIKEVNSMVLTRSSRMCNFMEYNQYKIVYKRYASLYFVTLVGKGENELHILEIIHHYVEILDKYFDELMMAGNVMEPSKKVILKAISTQEYLTEQQADDNQKSGK